MKPIEWKTGTPSKYVAITVDDRTNITANVHRDPFGKFDISVKLTNRPDLRTRVFVRRRIAGSQAEAKKAAVKIVESLAAWWNSCPEILK